MSEKRFTYTTKIITDKKGYRKDYIWSNETLLNTEQIVAILNAQDEYIDYVTKERNLACNKLDNYKEKILRKSCENCGYFYLFDEEAIQISREIGEDLEGFGECHYHGDCFHKRGLCNKWMDE